MSCGSVDSTNVESQSTMTYLQIVSCYMHWICTIIYTYVNKPFPGNIIYYGNNTNNTHDIFIEHLCPKSTNTLFDRYHSKEYYTSKEYDKYRSPWKLEHSRLNSSQTPTHAIEYVTK
jgi:hypothetical protein